MKYFLYGLVGWGLIYVLVNLNQWVYQWTGSTLIEWLPLLLIFIIVTFIMGAAIVTTNEVLNSKVE